MKYKRIFLFIVGAFLTLSLSLVNAATIDFEDLSVPGLFVDQAPLAEEYVGLGVRFQGTGEVLNQGSSFRGVPYSVSNNFLAFSSAEGASPPETISFDSTMSYFDLDFAGSTGTATLTAYLGDILVGTPQSISADLGVWNELSFSSGEFNKIVFSTTGDDGTFVIDNLNFVAAVPVPAAIWLFISGLIGLFGARKLK